MRGNRVRHERAGWLARTLATVLVIIALVYVGLVMVFAVGAFLLFKL